MSSVWPRVLVVVGSVFLVAFLGACESPDPADANVEPPPSHLDSLSTTVPPPADPGTPPALVRSQTLYVPAYSHIYLRDARRSTNLATTLSIRNTSTNVPITLSAIDYYDSNGEHVRAHLDTTRALGPLASTYVVVEVDDIRGGVGANFIVRWQAEAPVPPPVVETVMITGANTQGISFRSTARVLREDRVPATAVPADSVVSPDERP
ncbi:DUF3124 domain-containing protein [Salinibacter altiplanensis]|uniref:DUF3124 domain-containing protein n=1 Tax=Salinibacter altiplanensis TaxID=1803181 RepID=UPI000C9F517F|nr:DUF3124 domain-containing protein [Salinibacter altiplanensis]